jgi:hypothetical protein
MSKYIVLADSEPGVLELQRTALGYFYGGRVLTATSATQFLSVLDENGSPEIACVADHFLSSSELKNSCYFLEEWSPFPLIGLKTSHSKSSDFKGPLVYKWLDKPFGLDDFTALIRSMISTPFITPTHVPISMKTLLILEVCPFDFYLRLSHQNFVKVLQAKDPFTESDEERFHAKGIRDLYITASDSHSYLKRTQEFLRRTDFKDPIGQIDFGMNAIEEVSGILRALGFTPKAFEDTKDIVDLAIDLLSRNVSLGQALKKSLSRKRSAFNKHIGLLAFLSCAFVPQMDWAKESSKQKLVLAALVHDLALGPEFYDQKTIHVPENFTYRMHPTEAASYLQTLRFLPPEVDLIVAQHHENPKGKGFPRGLSPSGINDHSALFIVLEELIEFVGESEAIDKSLLDYLSWGAKEYDQGIFRRIFEVILSRILEEVKI